MSQLFELKRGGVGHYNDVVKEQFTIFLEHLSVVELDALALKLTKTPIAHYKNENDILCRARLILNQPQLLTSEATKGAIENIAFVLCIKTRPGKTEAKELATTIIKNYLPIAVADGFKDEEKFFQYNFS
jgi:hypothetical protein